MPGDVFGKGSLGFGRCGEISFRFGYLVQGVFRIVKTESVSNFQIASSFVVEDIG